MERTDRLSAAVARYVELIHHLQDGDYDRVKDAHDDAGPLAKLGEALSGLARTLALHCHELTRIDQIVQHVNAGVTLDEILERVYDDFRDLIPYNRIGLSLLVDDGTMVCSRWAKTDQDTIRLRRNYKAPLAGSSLQTIVDSGQPRILNDLEAYLRGKPESESTRLIVAEGIRSSLTCPLIANGHPIGFLFFSSVERNTYRDVHIDTFSRLAHHLAIIVERGAMVSELLEQKQAIERQHQELQHLGELKTSFLGIAAHDLRSPLSLIDMATTFLLDARMAATEAERDTVLRDVQHQARHMLTLIDRLLDITEIESGRLKLAYQPLPLRDFLIETVQRHNTLAASKRTRIILDEAPEDGVTIHADPLRLRQIMDNLISNAVKFSPADSRVTVRAEYTPAHWRISVTDSGPGILPKDRPHLFESFARLSAQPTGGERSTGLGLAITRRIVEAHGGQIGVDSVSGEGAMFWFTLPHEV